MTTIMAVSPSLDPHCAASPTSGNRRLPFTALVAATVAATAALALLGASPAAAEIGRAHV